MIWSEDQAESCVCVRDVLRLKPPVRTLTSYRSDIPTRLYSKSQLSSITPSTFPLCVIMFLNSYWECRRQTVRWIKNNKAWLLFLHRITLWFLLNRRMLLSTFKSRIENRGTPKEKTKPFSTDNGWSCCLVRWLILNCNKILYHRRAGIVIAPRPRDLEPWTSDGRGSFGHYDNSTLSLLIKPSLPETSTRFFPSSFPFNFSLHVFPANLPFMSWICFFPSSLPIKSSIRFFPLSLPFEPSLLLYPSIILFKSSL